MASTSDAFSEEKTLLARIDDAVRLCEQRPIYRFIGFLDEHQTAVCCNYLKKQIAVSYCFYGGSEHAHRLILGISGKDQPPEPTDFPIETIGFSYRSQASISHRDVLGSLIGCGITRDKIGDIFCFEELAVAFVHRNLADFLAENITRIGREGVRVLYPFTGTIDTTPAFKEVNGTVASPRLDAVLKVLLGASREQAAQLIRSASVQVDHQIVSSVSKTITAGETISVRGYGRYRVEDVSETTKKGRLILKAVQFV